MGLTAPFSVDCHFAQQKSEQADNAHLQQFRDEFALSRCFDISLEQMKKMAIQAKRAVPTD